MNVTILIGYPASGKTTYTKSVNDNDLVKLSSDDIREELYGDASDQTHNQEVFDELYSRMYDALSKGRDVLIDATSICRRERYQALKIAKKFNADTKAIIFKTPIAVCIRRNDNRDRKVPDEVFDYMIRKFENPSIEEGFTDISVINYNANATTP